MRNLRRNTSLVFFKLYEGEEEIKGPWDNNTGITYPKYSELKSAKLTVSPSKGTSETDMFGTLEQYDKTLTTSDVNCEINESAILWLDGADTDGAWNYIVKKVGRWKNSVSYAVSKVEVSVAQAQMSLIQMANEEQSARKRKP